VSERAEPSELTKSRHHHVGGYPIFSFAMPTACYWILLVELFVVASYANTSHFRSNRIDVSSVAPLKVASFFFTSLRKQKCAAKTVLMQRARQWSRRVINRSGVENVGVMTLLYLTASRLSFVVGLAQLRVAVPSLSPGGGEEPVSM